MIQEDGFRASCSHCSGTFDRVKEDKSAGKQHIHDGWKCKKGILNETQMCFGNEKSVEFRKSLGWNSTKGVCDHSNKYHIKDFCVEPSSPGGAGAKNKVPGKSFCVLWKSWESVCSNFYFSCVWAWVKNLVPAHCSVKKNVIWGGETPVKQACCVDSIKWQLSLFAWKITKGINSLYEHRNLHTARRRVSSTHLQSNYELWYRKMRSSVAFQQCSPEVVWKEEFVIEVKIFEWEWGSSSSVHLHFCIFSEDQMLQYRWNSLGQCWAL